MNMIKFNENELKYIKERIDEDIQILQVEKPTDIEQYAIKELSENGYTTIEALENFKNKLQLANEDKIINKQVEEYCIWIMAMWLYLRFDDEEDDLDNSDEDYRSIYGKIFRDENDKQRYYGDEIIFYDAD